MKRNEWFNVLKHASYLTQFGVSLLMPMLLCMAGAWFLTTRFSAPGWLYLPALLLGLGGGAAAFASFAKYVSRVNGSHTEGEKRK